MALYLGCWELAQRRLDQARLIYEPARMLASLAMVDWALGYMYQVLGEEEASKDAYLRALNIARSPQHRSKVTEADALTQLGLLYQVQKDWTNAAATFTAAIELAQELDEDHRCAMLLHRKGLVCVQQGDVRQGLELFVEAVERIERLRVAMIGEDLKLGLLGTAQQVYESIVLAYLDRKDREVAFRYVERARARAFLDLLAQRDQVLNSMQHYQPVALHQLQMRLSHDEILLEYYTLGVTPPGAYFLNKIPPSNTQLRSLLTTKPEILLFAVTVDDITVHRINFDPNKLQPLLASGPGSHILTNSKLRWLYTKLLGPVETLLDGARVVYIAPHGPLHHMPFAALIRPDGEALLAPDGPALVYAPSATVLCTCLDRTPRREGQMLALGYNDHGVTGLRYAEHEANLLSQLAHGSAYTGSVPKSKELLRVSPELRSLHIAGHAVYTARDPLGSYLRLGDGDDIDARTLMRRLQLNSTLVTLNACTTGLSHVASGDELLGLPRAFLYAGEATIVCSLHEVDDLAAFVLMYGFFMHLAHGFSPAVALHHAQLWLKKLHRDEVAALLQREVGETEDAAHNLLNNYDTIPFEKFRFWAPFIVIGKP